MTIYLGFTFYDYNTNNGNPNIGGINFMINEIFKDAGLTYLGQAQVSGNNCKTGFITTPRTSMILHINGGSYADNQLLSNGSRINEAVQWTDTVSPPNISIPNDLCPVSPSQPYDYGIIWYTNSPRPAGLSPPIGPNQLLPPRIPLRFRSGPDCERKIRLGM